MRKLLVIALFANAAMLGVRALQEARPFPAEAQGTINDIIIDNGELGTSFKGSWAISGAPNPFGTNSLYNSASNNWYQWLFTVPETGQYDIQAWWTSLASRQPAARYRITWPGGDDGEEVTVDQRVNGGKWNVLETLPFLAGDTVRVTVHTVSGHSTSADAMRLLRRPESIPQLTLEEKEILSRFSLNPLQPFRRPQPGELTDAYNTAVITIRGSIHLTDAPGEPGSLLIGSDSVLVTPENWPEKGARIEGRVEAASFQTQ
jgi:hypothetical protein